MTTSELATSLRTAIATLHKTLRKQVYSEHAYSMTEMETIGYLYRNSGSLPTELAEATKVTTQSMSQILGRLHDANIISRTPSGDDRRKVNISLTAEGKKMVEKTRYDRDEKLRTIIEEHLSEKEIQALEKLLPLLNKLADAP
jgi:DNA-binding MarR family transcriptional regulator